MLQNVTVIQYREKGAGRPEVVAVISALRRSDKTEIIDATGHNPATAIISSWNNSCKKWVVLKNGKAVALFGVDEISASEGSPWFVATDEINTIRSFIIKNSLKYIEEMKASFDKLSNFVSVDSKSIRWLKWCGFDVLNPQPHGPFEKLFHPFKMEM